LDCRRERKGKASEEGQKRIGKEGELNLSPNERIREEKNPRAKSLFRQSTLVCRGGKRHRKNAIEGKGNGKVLQIFNGKGGFTRLWGVAGRKKKSNV